MLQPPWSPAPPVITREGREVGAQTLHWSYLPVGTGGHSEQAKRERGNAVGRSHRAERASALGPRWPLACVHRVLQSHCVLGAVDVGSSY